MANRKSLDKVFQEFKLHVIRRVICIKHPEVKYKNLVNVDQDASYDTVYQQFLDINQSMDIEGHEPALEGVDEKSTSAVSEEDEHRHKLGKSGFWGKVTRFFSKLRR